jgi:glutathione peroxidase-family protein
MYSINLSYVPVLLFISNLLLAQSAKINEAAPDFKLEDSSGQEHALSAYKGKYIVLEWNNFGCPFVRKHYDSGNMQKLQKTYREKGVIWLTICSSAKGKQGFFEGTELKNRIKQEGVTADAYLLDRTGNVGKMYGAKTTPHMFIVNPEGKLIYGGAIDDKASTDREDIAGATNYVQVVLNAAMAGNPLPLQVTTPYGCSVKY